MDRTTQILRSLAVITLIICVAIILYQVPALSQTFTYSSYVNLNSPFNVFAWVTCSALGFATGIAALVVAAQRHHRRWFVPLLVPSIVTPYGPFLVSFAFPRIVIDPVNLVTFERFLVFSYTLLPFVTALAVLVYTFRYRRQPITPAPVEETDLEIEYTRLT